MAEKNFNVIHSFFFNESLNRNVMQNKKCTFWKVFIEKKPILSPDSVTF